MLRDECSLRPIRSARSSACLSRTLDLRWMRYPSSVPVLNGDHDAYRECRMWLFAEPVSKGKSGAPARTPARARLAPVFWGLSSRHLPCVRGDLGVPRCGRAPLWRGPQPPQTLPLPALLYTNRPSLGPRASSTSAFSARAESEAPPAGSERDTVPCVRGAGPRGEVEARLGGAALNGRPLLSPSERPGNLQ